MNWKQRTVLSVASFMLLTTNGTYYHKAEATELDESNIKVESKVTNKSGEEKTYKQIPQNLISHSMIYDKIREYYTSRGVVAPSMEIRNVKKIDEEHYEVEVFAVYEAIQHETFYYLLEYKEQEEWRVMDYSADMPPEDWNEYHLKTQVSSCVLKYAAKYYDNFPLKRIKNYTKINDDTISGEAIFERYIDEQGQLKEIVIHVQFVLRKDSDSSWRVQSMEEISKKKFEENGVYYRKAEATELDESNIKVESKVTNKSGEEKTYKQIPQNLISHSMIYDKIREYYTSRGVVAPSMEIRNVKKIDEEHYEVEVFTVYEAIQHETFYYLEYNEQEGWRITDDSIETPPEDWNEYHLKTQVYLCVLKYYEDKEDDIFLLNGLEYTKVNDDTVNGDAILQKYIDEQGQLKEIVIHVQFVLRKDSDSSWRVQSIKETSREVLD